MNIAGLFTRSLVAVVLTAGMVAYCSTASAQITHSGDVKIDGSLAIGYDTQSSTSFGFDTMRLRENNLRIHFDDTSVAASFPPNDWRITINDSSNGGDNYFSIDDATAGRQVFRVDAGARSNALYVDSQGDVGIGTSTPATDIDIKVGDTPTVRLQQDGTSGFQAQTWDVAGNETNFFIRDVTNGSKLPFRIRPGAPTSSIEVEADGQVNFLDGSNPSFQLQADGQLLMGKSTSRVGIATSTPSGPLHIDSADVFLVEDDGDVGVGTTNPLEDVHIARDDHATLALDCSAGSEAGIWIYEGGSRKWEIYKQGSTDNLNVFSQDLSASVMLIQNSNGYVGLRNSSPGHPLVVGTNSSTGNGAHVTTGGVWTNGSSREFKENIDGISTAEAREAVMNLEPVKYNYKLEPDELYAGFIAEDVPDLVATNSRKYLSTMDIVSVVTKVVQDQQQTIDKLNQRIEQLEANAQTQN